MVGGICDGMETFHGEGHVGWHCRTRWMDGKKESCVVFMGSVVNRLGKKVHANANDRVLFDNGWQQQE